MDKKTYIAVIVMLSIVLIIALGGWIHTRNKLVQIGINDYGQYEESLQVCEEIHEGGNYDECIRQLEKFGRTLEKYETFLRRVELEAKLPSNVNVSNVRISTSTRPATTSGQ